MGASHYIMNLTRKGQVTVPAAVRRFLGVKPGQPVAFEIRDGQVHVTSAQVALESVFGAVKPLARPEDFERIAEIAHVEHAGAVARETEVVDAVR